MNDLATLIFFLWLFGVFSEDRERLDYTGTDADNW